MMGGMVSWRYGDRVKKISKVLSARKLVPFRTFAKWELCLVSEDTTMVEESMGVILFGSMCADTSGFYA
jgi:hypothetical protein